VLPGGKCLKSNLYTISSSAVVNEPCSAYFDGDSLLLAVRYSNYPIKTKMVALLVYTKNYRRMFHTDCVADVVVTDGGLMLKLRNSKLVFLVKGNARALVEVLEEASKETGCEVMESRVQTEDGCPEPENKVIVEERVDISTDCFNLFSSP
jgi:hypothetical protein